MFIAKFINDNAGRCKLQSFTLRLILGLVFVYAGYAKLRQPWYVFAGMIDNYGVVPPSVSEVIARTLPSLEILLGLALLTGVCRKISSAAAVIILLPFFALMVWAYARGMKIDCGCFGPGQTLGPRTILRDAALVAASAWLMLLTWRSPGCGAHTGSPEPAGSGDITEAV
mgnify:CR=1 FL=1|jgi:uncharacterized membrane protein YphA (DoxX/SURF4 family)